MGMFDYVRCEKPLPGLTEKIKLQTKDMPDPSLETYTITSEGRLIYHSVKYEEVPLEERFFYKPGMDPTSLEALAGSIRVVPDGDVDTNWHGHLNFYGRDSTGNYHEFNAKFTDGQLVSIERISVE